jgi:hypothetical protein
MNPKATAVTEPWNCQACSLSLSSPFCPSCGESPLRPRDLTLRGFADQVFEACTSMDARLIRSLRWLVARPGALTVAYLQGQRNRYTRPLQLFFFANVLFFAMQSLVGVKVFSTPLNSHLHNQAWSPLAQRWVAHRLESRQTSLETYAPVFDQAVALNAKSLIILMVIPFALLPPVVFFRSRRSFVVHVVFSLHLYAFLLLLFCAVIAVLALSRYFGGTGLESENMDHWLSILEVAICAVYLYSATGRVYGSAGIFRALQVVPLVLALAFIVLGYRFVLLLITLHGT